MTEEIEEKYYKERLEHEKSEAKLFEQTEKLKEENKYLAKIAKQRQATIESLLKENADLKDSVNRFTCQSECLRYKQWQKAEQKLKDIRSSIPMIVDGSAVIFNEIIAIINRK